MIGEWLYVFGGYHIDENNDQIEIDKIERHSMIIGQDFAEI